MRKILLLAAAAALTLAAGQAMAQKKTLAVVVKGLDNPFFTVLGNGCALWNEENPESEYECLYTGPALSSDEAGEVQLVVRVVGRDVAVRPVARGMVPVADRATDTLSTTASRLSARGPR